MPRLQPAVLPMTGDHVDRVAHLWIARREELGTAGEGPRRAVAEGRFREAVERDYVSIHVAILDEVVVGYLWATTVPMTANLAEPVMSLEDAYVVPEFRGQGVGRSLLAAAAAQAQKKGIDHVGAALPTQDKDANRALARLGFAAVVTRRVAQTTGLVRKLHGDDRRVLVDQVLLQRRRRAQRSRLAAAVAATP